MAALFAATTTSCDSAAPPRHPYPSQPTDGGVVATTVDAGDSTTSDPPDAGAALAIMQPVRIIFDLHVDPLSGPDRRASYRKQLANATWLLDRLEPIGAKVTFLAGGDFMEYCIDPAEVATCTPVLQRLYRSGGSIGTHSHDQIRQSAHTWVSLGRNATLSDARRLWDDHIGFVNRAIRIALGRADDAGVSDVNNIRGTHIPSDSSDLHRLLREYGFAMQQSGTEEDFYTHFSHYIWNSFRPAAELSTAENLRESFVVSPVAPVVGRVGVHKGILQDRSIPHMKTMFLSLLMNWLERERKGGETRVWCFGWGAHTHDLDPGSATRTDALQMIDWLKQNFVGKQSRGGNVVAEWSSSKGARDAYLEWESRHSGVSSFNYDATTRDLARYPYLRPVNALLRDSYFEGPIAGLASGVVAHRFSFATRPFVAAWMEHGSGTIDLSGLFSSRVRATAVSTGAESEVAANMVSLGEEPVIVCAAEDCDLAQGGLAAQDGGRPPSVDGGRPPRVDGGGPPRADGGLPPRVDGGHPPRRDGGAGACDSGTCPNGRVCCTAGGCAGLCVPDCRTRGINCPTPVPTCNQSSGVCE